MINLCDKAAIVIDGDGFIAEVIDDNRSGFLQQHRVSICACNIQQILQER